MDCICNMVSIAISFARLPSSTPVQRSLKLIDYYKTVSLIQFSKLFFQLKSKSMENLTPPDKSRLNEGQN